MEELQVRVEAMLHGKEEAGVAVARVAAVAAKPPRASPKHHTDAASSLRTYFGEARGDFRK